MTHSWTLSNVEHILFPTDFLEPSEAAKEYALALANDLNATLHILHVVDRAAHVETTRIDLELERRKGVTHEDVAEELVNEEVEKLAGAPIKVIGHWREGKVDEEILRLIDVLDIGLVVMGTHARRKEDVLAHKSNYLRTIHDADVPVIAVRRPEHGRAEAPDLVTSINKVLCPCDLSEFSHDAVSVAADLCRRYDAELVLAHIVHTRKEHEALEGLGGKGGEQVNTQHLLDKLLEPHSDIRTKIIIAKGKPVPELIEIYKDQNCDMVVVSTHGRKSISQRLVGSLAEGLVVALHCPIVSVRPERVAERFPA
jgi:nucleotide-binding universal stress UspA family protein